MNEKLNAADEAPLDTSRHHVLEERALARALALAEDGTRRTRVQALATARLDLMAARDAFHTEATARRHARGEIYSATRIAALNALGPSAEELEKQARTLYERHTNAVDVLKTHARVHFVNVLMMARLNLAHYPADVRDAAHAMQAREEAFCTAWLATIDDADFAAEIRTEQREALRSMRTATRPMYLATRPDTEQLDEQDAAALGKAWNKLDELAESLGVEPLSNFIAVPDEDAAAGVPAARVLASVAALCDALRRPEHKVPAKKAVLAGLEKQRRALHMLETPKACAWYEIDL